MKAHRHVQYILARATKRLFVIRRLKSAGCGTSDLIYVYISLIRSILETACPVFQPLLTEGDKDKIERIQKIVLKIILGDSYDTYDQACINVNLNSLESRRVQMCLNFGLKCLKNNNHKTLFPRAPLVTCSHSRSRNLFVELSDTKNHLFHILPNYWMLTSVNRFKVLHVLIVLYPYKEYRIRTINNIISC